MTRGEHHRRLLEEREEERARALRLRTEGEGLSYAAIGRELGVSAQRAHRLCTEPPSPRTTYRGWEEREIIEAIREWELEHGEIPTQEEWKDPERPYWCPSSSAVRRCFGSWNEAIRQAGFEPRDACPPAYTHEEGFDLHRGYRPTPPPNGPDHPWRRSIERAVRRAA